MTAFAWFSIELTRFGNTMQVTGPSPTGGRSGRITGVGGKCLDVTSAGTANAAKNLVNTGSGKCLDATGQSSASGTRLQIRTCGSGANQKWTLP